MGQCRFMWRKQTFLRDSTWLNVLPTKLILIWYKIPSDLDLGIQLISMTFNGLFFRKTQEPMLLPLNSRVSCKCSLQPFWEAWFTPELSKPQETLSGEWGGHHIIQPRNKGRSACVVVILILRRQNAHGYRSSDRAVREGNEPMPSPNKCSKANGHMFQLHFVNLEAWN